MLKYILLTITLLSSGAVAAIDDVLTVDRSVSGSFQSSFPNENNTQPDISDFKVLNSVLMSNEAGERWAVMTIENLASGQRTLNQNHLMALFANGERLTPQIFKRRFAANEILSITLAFGEHKFPILEIYPRN
ncbi:MULTISPECIES: hypothetical protein [Shewanella]|uniref:Uncharacterized protein n=1 Tax=Shewanella marisflavi TaxID=260364 RepID=A0AAC9TY56_9GAMM|nr:hypothetical protein [Shewanella marisflavi]ASJ95624.1 hypothetical protein CFF01_02950 [Shewanella marisflavi]